MALPTISKRLQKEYGVFFTAYFFSNDTRKNISKQYERFSQANRQ